MSDKLNRTRLNIQIETVSISDSGKARQKNEDSFGYLSGEFGYLFVVCDGMGGSAGGELASKTAVDTILGHFDAVPEFYTPYKELQSAFARANAKIRQIATETSGYEGMGSTAVSALVIDDQLVVAHLGDSRVYLYRNKRLFQLTKDHSLVQTMVEKKQIKASKAAHHEQKHIITKALGPRPSATAEVSNAVTLYNGDILLLCTDGLTNELTEREIKNIIKKNPLEKAGQLLVDAANSEGGHDNITIQLVSISGCKDLPIGYIDKNPIHKEHGIQNLLIWGMYLLILILIGVLGFISYRLLL
jgi:protein phosphatase